MRPMVLAGRSGSLARRRLVRPAAVAREVGARLVLLVAGAVPGHADAVQPVEEHDAEARAPERGRALPRGLVAAAHDDEHDPGDEDRDRHPEADDAHHVSTVVPGARREVSTRPARIVMTPTSCSALGRSAKISAPRM